jgi:predicted NUDIX family NTP pyrophosphohydrolase
MCRRTVTLEFFLIHPGGPFWKNKNDGAWSIPKGLIEDREDLLAAAVREFREETGILPSPPFYELGTSKMKSGKVLFAWAFKGDWDPADGIISNTINIEFPPRSKKFITIPEADRGEWMTPEKASIMINQAQVIFLERAREILQ